MRWIYLLLLCVLIGCKRNPTVAEIFRNQWFTLVTATEVRLQNNPTADDIKDLTIQLETFHSLNEPLFSVENEAGYKLLDAYLQSVSYLYNRSHPILDPAHNTNDFVLMMTLRPELEQRIKAGMEDSYDKRDQNTAFWAAIYAPYARQKAIEICEKIRLILQASATH